MKKCKMRLISLSIILSLLCSLGAGILPLKGNKTVSEAAESDYLDLNQQEIVEEMGAGWNLGNQLEASVNGTPKEDAWSKVKVTEDMIRTVRENGFRSIRIPVSYLSMIGAGPDYTIDSKWLDRVQQVVDWAVKYDLYVIMNIHGDGYSSVKGGWILPTSGDQDTIKEKFGAVWKQIAGRFQDYDQHIIFESMNEIGAHVMEKAGVTDKEISDAYVNINAYNQIFVDTVRQSGGNNDKRWLLIPGINTDIDHTTGDYGFQIPQDTHRSADIPEEEKRLMISVHYYTPWDFCGKEDYLVTQWGEDADPDKKVGYGQEGDMEKAFAKLNESFTSKGYPVVIGEYGSIDKSKQKDSGVGKEGSPDERNTRFRADYAAAVCGNSLENGCIPVYWDNGWNGDFGFGIFDRTTYQVTQPEILAAIMSFYDQGEGTATAVAIDRKSLTMSLVEGKQELKATVTPSDAKDQIQWRTTDESVATVSYKGIVTPKGEGTCLITASVAGGATAACVVKVKALAGLQAGLYAQNSADWNTLEGDSYLELTEDGGGSFTINLSGTKEQMSKLCSIFLKDVAVQKGLSETCNLDSAQFTVDSLDFNGHPCTMEWNTFDYKETDAVDDGKPTGKKTVLDLCMLNSWWPDANCINELTINPGTGKDLGYSFPSDFYVEGTNVLTMKVTVKDAVLKKDSTAQEDVEATSLSLSDESITVTPGELAVLIAEVTPDNATEKVLWFSENPKIATVDQDGFITGVKSGKTKIHALTLSGQDVSCPVTVEGGENPEETASAAPSVEPSTTPSVLPSVEPSASPSVKPSTMPSILPSMGPTAKPSMAPSAAPNTQPTQNPGVQPTKNPASAATAKPGSGSTGTGTGLSKGAVFTVGKLKYKVTATGKKNTVAVQAPKSRKAKSLAIPASVKKDGMTYSVTSLGDSAFKNCKKMTKITIGKNVVSIGKNAFAGAKKLKRITVKSVKIKKISRNAFRGIHAKAVIKVPKKKLKAYRKLWKKKGQKKSVRIK